MLPIGDAGTDAGEIGSHLTSERYEKGTRKASDSGKIRRAGISARGSEKQNLSYAKQSDHNP